MKAFCVAIAIVVAGFFVSAGDRALAGVIASIDLSSQTMTVTVNGRTMHRWAISSGRSGYRTPTGNYRPTRMHKRYFSKKYHGAPMPYSIFFRGGYAIHGTNHVSRLGRPASHGCVRLHPNNAARLFQLVRQHGPGNTSIRIRH